MKCSLYFFIAFCLFYPLTPTHAQQSMMGRGVQDRSLYYQFGDAFFCEPIVTGKNNSDSVSITFLFRIMNDVLAFTKAPRTKDNRGTYVATPFVTVEIRNSENVIVQRVGWKDSAFTQSFDKTNSKSHFVNGAVASLLTTGTYIADVTLGDKESAQIRKIKSKPIIIGKPSAAWYSNVFFARNYNDTLKSNLLPVQMGGDMPFGTDNIAACITIFGKPEGLDYSWKLEQTRSVEDKFASWGTFATVESKAKADPTKRIIFTDESLYGSGVDTYISVIPTDVGRNTALLTLPMPVSSIVPGHYALKIFAPHLKDTITHTFDVRWDRMPMSLIRPTYAIECMYYILTDDEYDEMNSGNDEDKRKKLFSYWKAKDPTPNTTFNEAMAEYFRRVDFAFFNFQTLSESDGAKSQRGKIYILYGSPKHIEKHLTDDNKVQEEWSYPDKIKKEFLFEKTSNGVFKLMQSKDL